MTTISTLDGLLHAGTRPLLISGDAVWTGIDLHREAYAAPSHSPTTPPRRIPGPLRERLNALAAGSVHRANPPLTDAVHVLVAAPWHDTVVDAVLGVWSVGACVHHVDDATPVRLLAMLQRLGIDHALLTAAQWAGMEAHPAFGLTDLDRLRHTVIVDDAAPGVGSTGKDIVGIHAKASPRIVPPWDDASLQHDVATATEASLADVDIAAGIAATRLLSQTALRAMLHGLRQCGVFKSPQLTYETDDVLRRIRADPHHRALVRRWLRVLSDEGLLIRNGSTYRLSPAAADVDDATMHAGWDDVERHWLAAGETVLTIAFARESAAKIPALIAGEVQAVHLLFPEGRLDLARSLYRESLSARYQHRAVAACVQAIAKRSPSRLRVLEVGGGTGATTDQVLPALSECDVDYLFTDVSRFFTAEAGKRYAAPRCRTGLYDIDRSPREQGHATSRFDVIVAGGVLNAARNTDQSLRWLAGLLAPGGWLVLSEPTAEEYWVMASQAFMLAEPDDERADTQATFLSWPQWRQALHAAGLQCVVDLPPANHPVATLGHRVFAVRAATQPVPSP